MVGTLNGSVTIKESKDEDKIFDSFLLKIENYHPAHNGQKDHLIDPKDWILFDYSPKTKNNEKSVSTSTSTGFDIGMFGGTPTIGLNFSQSDSREWMIADYDLLTSATVNPKSPSAVTWHVIRAKKDSDPEIAQTAFAPDFEAVFRSSQNAAGRRYSVVSALAIPIFADQIKVKDIATKKPLGLLASLVGNLFSSHSPTFTEEKTTIETEGYFTHMFSLTLLIDWVSGRVESIDPQTIGGRARLLAFDHIAKGNADQSGAVTRKLEEIMGSMDRMVAEPALVYPTFAGDSPVARLVPAEGQTSLEVVIPPDRLFYYFGGLTVGQELDTTPPLTATWGAFSNTLLIRGIDPANGPISIFPTGYQKDGTKNKKKSKDNGIADNGHKSENLATASDPVCVSINSKLSIVDQVSLRSALPKLTVVPEGSGIIIPIENQPFGNCVYANGTKYIFDSEISKSLSSDSIDLSEAGRFAFFSVTGGSVVGLGASSEYLIYSSDGFRKSKYPLNSNMTFNIDGTDISIENVLRKIGPAIGKRSVVIAYPITSIVSQESNFSRDQSPDALIQAIHNCGYICVVGEDGMVYCSLGEILREKESGDDKGMFLGKCHFSYVKYDDHKDTDEQYSVDEVSIKGMPAPVYAMMMAHKALKTKGASMIVGSFIKAPRGHSDGPSVMYFGI